MIGSERRKRRCGEGEDPLFPYVGLFTCCFEYPQDMTAEFPQSNKSKREQGKNHNAFYDLAS